MERTKVVSRFVLAVSLASLLVILASSFASASGGQAYPPGSNAAGASYGTWGMRLMRFYFGTGFGRNPLVHETKCKVSIRLRFGVVMLPVSGGGATTVRCSIPGGEPILVTPGGFIGTLGIDANTPAALRSTVAADAAVITGVRVVIDGVAIDHVRRFGIAPRLFPITYPTNNIMGVQGGKYRAMFKGWVIMLHPLAAGRHVIVAKDMLPSGPAQSTYVLNVQP